MDAGSFKLGCKTKRQITFFRRCRHHEHELCSELWLFANLVYVLLFTPAQFCLIYLSNLLEGVSNDLVYLRLTFLILHICLSQFDRVFKVEQVFRHLINFLNSKTG